MIVREDDGLLTMQEAADLCGVSYETFRRWVSAGKVDYLVVGPTQLYRFRKSNVLRLITEVHGPAASNK